MGGRYIRVFENIKLPSIYEVKDLDVIPGNFSVRLTNLFQFYIIFQKSLRFSMDTAGESVDPLERNSLMVENISIINSKIDGINKDLIELSLDFQKRFLSTKY